ncbi:MAG: hypothetical protein KF830_06450 [Planctomycetes bacterium]|nr:hypothetical protein [Planctomycetota bacterium]
MTAVLALFQDPEVPIQAGSDFGGTTLVHPIGVAALGLMALLALTLPRRGTFVPVVLMLCFIPAGQRVVIATLDFSFIRVLMLVVWLRMFLRREVRPIVWNHLDRTLLVWAAASIVFGTLRDQTVGAFVFLVGTSADAVMVYFFFRLLIRDYRDLVQVASVFMACSIVVLVFFVIENQTSRNMFAVLGGVPEFTEVRGDRLRCQGAFAHSILAGCFWACVIPFYFVCAWLRRRWLVVLLGAFTAMAIVRLSASSTPIMALVFGTGALCAYPIRSALRWIRWLVFGWACVLQFALMNTPVWHLLARVDLVGGSTGWHRFHLVDKTIEHVREWILFGTPRTGHWGPGLHDVTNQFVAEAIAGGITRLVLFVTIIVLAFVGCSRSLRLEPGGRTYKLVTWMLGTALFMHCMNFIGVTYFDQIVALWYLNLAAVSSLTLVPGARVEEQLAELRL